MTDLERSDGVLEKKQLLYTKIEHNSSKRNWFRRIPLMQVSINIQVQQMYKTWMSTTFSTQRHYSNTDSKS